jgi:hypothetical protein
VNAPDVTSEFAKLAAIGTLVTKARDGYKAFVQLRREEGWSEADLDEFAKVIKADFADGEGAAREIPIKDKADRIRLWSVFFDVTTAPVVCRSPVFTKKAAE